MSTIYILQKEVPSLGLLTKVGMTTRDGEDRANEYGGGGWQIVRQALRELAGGSMIMLPSGVEDLADACVSDYVLRAQGSPILAPLERVKFFKLVWDAVGSEFASRHTQYEMFYAGAGFVTKAHSFRTYDWDRSTALVDRLLDGYNLTEEINGS